MKKQGFLGVALEPPEDENYTPLLADFEYDFWWAKFRDIYAEPQRKKLEEIDEDERCEGLFEDYIIDERRRYLGLDRGGLIGWWAYRANRDGLEVANQCLSDFLDAPFASYPVVVINWVSGVTVDKVFDFGDGVKLVPICDLPEHGVRRKFLSTTFDPMISHYPQCALIAEALEPVVWRDGAEYTVPQLREKLTSYELLIGAVGNHHCFPVFSTTYRPDDIPYGPNFPYGLSHSIETLPHCPLIPITVAELEVVKVLSGGFFKSGEKERRSISFSLDRLRRSKCQMSLEQKALDLGIALETALLFDAHGKKGTDQLALTFRTRAAWLCGQNYEERLAIYRLMGKLYTYRSNVAHTGQILVGREGAFADLERATETAGQIVRQIIEKRCSLDWDEIVLGK